MPSASVPPPAEAIQPDRVVDPDGWLVITSWVVIALSAAQILLLSFGRDQGIYATVADGILRDRCHIGCLGLKPLASSCRSTPWPRRCSGEDYVRAPPARGRRSDRQRSFGFMRPSEVFFGVKRAGVVGRGRGAIRA
ncbi:MAG: hypothetical protein IPI67_13625 [Myxococcales bacterium]|nr:hypothetical protein [Myxococcales bacterium]